MIAPAIMEILDPLRGAPLPDVPAVKHCGFALDCGEFVLPAARAVGDAAPYKGKPKQSDKLGFVAGTKHL